jgi:hypothetical protein
MGRATGLFFIVVLSLTPELEAQESGGAAASREQQIQAEQAAKAASVTPAAPVTGSNFLLTVLMAIRKNTAYGPVRLQGGGMPGGAGFSVGPLLELRNRPDNVRWFLSATGSTRTYYTVRSGFVFPDFDHRRLGVGVIGGYLYAPRFNYFGEGPDSSPADHTSFLRESTFADLVARWRPSRRHVAWDVNTGLLIVNVGPGTNPRVPPINAIFGPATAPGLDAQGTFARVGTALDVNFLDTPLDFSDLFVGFREAAPGYRNIARDPHQGTRGTVSYQHYFDYTLNRFSFGRLAADLEHYIPFFARTRVLALHAGAAFSYHANDQVVPFYLQPTLGGPNDIRGFHRFRFYDENSLVLNAEHRWEVNSAFDMAIFADAGKVFNRPSQISLSHLESAVGFGVRFKIPVLMRIDVGFSHEGFRVWLQVHEPF